MRVKRAPLFRAESLHKGQIQIHSLSLQDPLYICSPNPLHDLSATELCAENFSQVRSLKDSSNKNSTTLGFTLKSEIEELFSEISSGIFCEERGGLSAEIHTAYN